MKNLKALFLFGFLLMGMSLYAQKTTITQKELPQTAQHFINKNFSGQKVTSVVKEVKYKMKTEYDVYFDNRMEIEFDGDGNWTEVDGKKSPIPTGFINSSIVNYVKQNFPTEKIIQIEKKRSKYEIELGNGIELIFDLNGNFKKIDD